MPPHTGKDAAGSLQPEAAGACETLDTKPQTLSPSGYLNPADKATGKKDCESEANSQPLIGKIISLEALVPEFISGSNAHNKILYLCNLSSQQGGKEQGGAKVRKVRRDGCCFYRSYMFGVFEQIFGNPKQVDSLKERVEGVIVPRMLATGYTRGAIDEFVEEMQSALERLKNPEATLADVEQLFNETGPSNYLVVFAKLVTAAEMKANADSFMPFLSGHPSVQDFCTREVEPMWVGAEQPQILALASAIGVPVEILYIDQSPGNKPSRHVFPDSPSPSVKLLYRPGHYDLLYL